MNIKNWSEFLKDVPTDILKAEIDRRGDTSSDRKSFTKEGKEISKAALSIMSDLDEAIEMFGTYSFEDKGPEEVMNITKIVDMLLFKPIPEIASILSEVLDNHHNYDHAKSLVNSIIGGLDGLDGDEFDSLLELDDRFEY